MVGGQVLPPAASTQSMTKVLIASMPSAGIAIFRNEPFSLPLPLGIISISSTVSDASLKSTCTTGTPMPHEVCSLRRVSGCTTERAQRVLARGAFTAAADGLQQVVPVDTATPRPMRYVVDRDAGVLAQQVVGRLGHADVVHHRRQHALRGGRGLAAGQPREAVLDVGRQHLQRADVQRLGGFFDGGEVQFHASPSDEGSRRIWLCSPPVTPP